MNGTLIINITNIDDQITVNRVKTEKVEVLSEEKGTNQCRSEIATRLKMFYTNVWKKKKKTQEELLTSAEGSTWYC